MNLTDLIIIYLACGAPFGVYYFLQNRENLNSAQLWLKTVLVILFWFLFIYVFFHKYVTKKLHDLKFVEINQTDSRKRLKIDALEKTFSGYLLQNEVEISLFEFREIFERYVGLTLALPENIEIVPDENEFFLITKHNNATLGQICLQRRNRLRLQSHQIKAREELLNVFAKMLSNVVEAKKMEFSLVEFFNLTEDFEAKTILDDIFRPASQIEKTLTVPELENEIWNSKENKRLQNQPTTILNLPNLTTSTGMPKPE
jgi:hypothetical protein